MKEGISERPVREGIPMNESDLKEWMQTFIDIQESIDKVMAEGEDIGTEKSTENRR